MIGLASAFRAGASIAARVVAIELAVVLAVVLVLRAKPYYAAPAYPMLIAAGAASLTPRLRVFHSPRAAIASACAAVAAGILTFAGTLPVLPESVLSRAALARINPDSVQFAPFQDVVAQIASAHREHAGSGPLGILTDSYGTAAAVELYGPALGLPAPICAANSYFEWGPPHNEPDAVLGIGYPESLLTSLFLEVTPVGSIKSPHGLDNRFDFPRTIYLCRGPRRPLRDAWPELKRFD
jgi:hypothetical protein